MRKYLAAIVTDWDTYYLESCSGPDQMQDGYFSPTWSLKSENTFRGQVEQALRNGSKTLTKISKITKMFVTLCHNRVENLLYKT